MIRHFLDTISEDTNEKVLKLQRIKELVFRTDKTI